MDRITKSLLEEFAKSNEEDIADLSKCFEHFCNYSIISYETNSLFDYDDVHTDKQQGIDGFGILVNNELIASIEELKGIIETNKLLDVKFIIIQSKSSESFKSSEILNFLATCNDFFDDDPKIALNKKMKILHSLFEEIYRNASLMTNGKPECKLYYVTTGKWLNDTNILAAINGGKHSLDDLNYFRNVEITPCDASKIYDLYMRTKNPIKASFTFPSKITTNSIANVTDAYIGLISFKDFREILIDDNDNLKDIFFDNLRDFLGSENPVNQEIHQTISKKDFDIFSLLNNGITIVADDLNVVGNKFTITDYQVVNGCQTCHVLFNNRHIIDIDTLHIPLKLIVTNNRELKKKITIATNRQTAIKPEQLASLSEFQERLEQFYSTFKEPENLYYERRTKQYARESITKTRIINIPTQIKSIVSMFLDKPHLASGYFGKTVDLVNKGEIFSVQDRQLPYFISGFSWYKLECLFRMKSLDAKYKKLRWHILMIFSYIFRKDCKPKLYSYEIEKICYEILNSLREPDKCKQAFQKAIKIIELSKINFENSKELYQVSNTELLKKTFFENNDKLDELISH